MKVREIMKHPVHTVRRTDSLNRAAQLMWSHDVGAVPVLDDDGRICGIITDRDVAMAAFLRGDGLARMRVSESMAPTVYSCHPDHKVAEAEELLARHRVHRLPVVEDGCLVGMLSTHDLLQAAVRQPRKVPSKELVRALGTVCEPRAPLVEWAK